MKKTVVTWFMVVILSVAFCAHACAELYPTTFVVSDIDEDNDMLILVDYNENAWGAFGIEDYDIGDIVSAIMDDNGTESIYDDSIVNMCYGGYMEGWE